MFYLNGIYSLFKWDAISMKVPLNLDIDGLAFKGVQDVMVKFSVDYLHI